MPTIINARRNERTAALGAGRSVGMKSLVGDLVKGGVQIRGGSSENRVPPYFSKFEN